MTNLIYKSNFDELNIKDVSLLVEYISTTKAENVNSYRSNGAALIWYLDFNKNCTTHTVEFLELTLTSITALNSNYKSSACHQGYSKESGCVSHSHVISDENFFVVKLRELDANKAYINTLTEAKPIIVILTRSETEKLFQFQTPAV